MKIQLFQYKLPFSKPFHTAGRQFRERDGLLVCCSDQKTEVLAEASPLPGHSTETIDETKAEILKSLKNWGNYFSMDFNLESLTYYTSTLQSLPSVEYAFSVLGFGILSSREQRDACDLLQCKQAEMIRVNAVTGLDNVESSILNMKDHYEMGFRTFKIKAGKNPGQLFRLINEAAGKFENSTFRIDANQSWDTGQAIEILNRLEGLPVEYCEEPVNCTDIKSVKKLASHTNIPIASDESLLQSSNPLSLVQTGLFRFIILKPTLYGSIFNLYETIRLAGSLDCKCVFTTAFESGVARENISVLASILGSKSYAHGLNTGYLFREDITKNNPITGSEIDSRNLKWSCSLRDIDKKKLSLIETYET